MVFSSSVFMFVFLPVVVALYFLMPGRKAKNVWLFVASLVFYAWGEPVYVVLMVVSIAVNWLLAILLGSSRRRESSRKALLAVSCVFNVLVIGFFKYEGFLAENVNALVGMELVPNLELPLPIGISFYTLQALSYVVDVYRKEVEPQRNILYLGMYVACFPQLIAGPIVRYQTIQDQVLNRKETLDDFSSGLRLFMCGLAKKVLLANTVAILAADMLEMGGENIGAIGAWAGLVAYTFQIFFDFSGYSDMAIGLGRMFGFKYLRNFNYPYIAKSVTEFWRRWHMSLSSFFRDYVYIPLGGSRVSVPRHIMNMLIVWGITGLWHGAAWNYILWGVFYGVLLVLEKYVWGKALEKLPSLLRHVYMIFIFMLGWCLFWITDTAALGQYFAALFGAYGLTGTMSIWQLSFWEYWPVFIACVAASTPLVPFLKERLSAWIEKRDAVSVLNEGLANARCNSTETLCVWELAPASQGRELAWRILSVFVDIILVLLLITCLFSIVSGSFNPFIYFQF